MPQSQGAFAYHLDHMLLAPGTSTVLLNPAGATILYTWILNEIHISPYFC